MRSIDEIYPFVEPGELIDGARDARLAAWWRMAADPGASPGGRDYNPSCDKPG